MSRYNHFSEHTYERISFSSIPVGGMFRNDFHLGGRRRIDIICVKTGELKYIENRSKKEHVSFSGNFEVSVREVKPRIEQDIKTMLNVKWKDTLMKAEIQHGYDFMDIAGLKIGDIVMCGFFSNSGNSKTSYIGLSDGLGIIKQKESGHFYVESINKMKVSKEVSNGRTGRNYKSWWEFEEKHIESPLTQIL